MSGKSKFVGFEYRMNWEVVEHRDWEKVVLEVLGAVDKWFNKFFMRAVQDQYSGCSINAIIADAPEKWCDGWNEPEVVGGRFEKGKWIDEWSDPELRIVPWYEVSYEKTMPDEVRLGKGVYDCVMRWIYNNPYRMRMFTNKVRFKLDLNMNMWGITLVKYETVEDMYEKRVYG